METAMATKTATRARAKTNTKPKPKTKTQPKTKPNPKPEAEAEAKTIQLNPTRGMETKTETKTKTGVYHGRTCIRHLKDKDERELLAKLRRGERKDAAKQFRMEYNYCRCQDKKKIIWCGGHRHNWSGASCGITWAGVYGESWICVVTKTGDLDVSRVNGYLRLDLADNVFRKFRSAAISEIEDLAHSRSKLRSKLAKLIKTPLGVVSVAGLPENGHKASCEYKETKFKKVMVEAYIREFLGEASSAESINVEELNEFEASALKSRLRNWRKAPFIDPDFDHRKVVWFIQKEMEGQMIRKGVIDQAVERESSDKYDAREAEKFLMNKMKNPVNYFTPEETVKTAISAFQRLCNKNFNADEIQVSVMDPDYFILSHEDKLKDAHVKHLETFEIKKYLSLMKDQEEWMVTEKVTKKVT